MVPIGLHIVLVGVGPGSICAWWIAWGCPELLRYILNILIIFPFSFSSRLLFLTLFNLRVLISSGASMPPLFVDLSVMGQGLLMLTKLNTLAAEESLDVGAFLIHVILISLWVKADPAQSGFVQVISFSISIPSFD